ncbi:hypothetical protein [Microtetraspora niveoalba]|uniref:hypothetical protein n=1 Tax=Microtetraspora niveoalba TaxID=46175 RepID=UPI0012FA45BD|nr:hypothetical protein [Microtetraspora niveoalba]
MALVATSRRAAEDAEDDAEPGERDDAARSCQGDARTPWAPSPRWKVPTEVRKIAQAWQSMTLS